VQEPLPSRDACTQLNTGMRLSEIRGLTWAQVDFLGCALTAMLKQWRRLFTGAQPEHYVFPHEKYGLAGNDRKPCAYESIPTEPRHRWKVAWESARKAAGVSCRFHDLRHTFI
jgi:integrase